MKRFRSRKRPGAIRFATRSSDSFSRDRAPQAHRPGRIRAATAPQRVPSHRACCATRRHARRSGRHHSLAVDHYLGAVAEFERQHVAAARGFDVGASGVDRALDGAHHLLGALEELGFRHVRVVGMRLIGATILAAACVVAVSACGQKGPLYLPPPPAAPQSKAPPPGSAPSRPVDRPFPDVPATNEKR
jgi:predicted small lipoprotein YifL